MLAQTQAGLTGTNLTETMEWMNPDIFQDRAVTLPLR